MSIRIEGAVVSSKVLLNELLTLSRDLWWTGDPWANDIFRDLDPLKWEELNHNPIALFQEILAQEHTIISRSWENRARSLLHRYEVFKAKPEIANCPKIAYFCMEFGLHEFLQIYSGGLGILAGDHIRSAGDLKVPFVGIGLMYNKGYFSQLIVGGEQGAGYIDYKRFSLPLETIGSIQVPYKEQQLSALIHKVTVGHATLLLLDTDVESNSDEQRSLTQSLYSGGKEMRIAQEILLGIGGVRALRELKIEVDVYHLNEGHAAFLLLERWIEEMRKGLSQTEAWASVRDQSVFTTHTPVPAGHDAFSWALVEQYLGTYRSNAGLPEGAFMDKGRENPDDWTLPLSMTVLGLNGCRNTNGVSKLHGAVSREMFKELNVHIGHITNGVHPTTWMAPEMAELIEEYLPNWMNNVCDSASWKNVDAIPTKALWTVRTILRRKLVDESRRILRRNVLNPNHLTIRFARRFATYKRGDLVFEDPDRLAAILDQGVQLIFAGKAHPADIPGQKVLANVLRFTRDDRFKDRVIFLPDYNAHLGRLMTQGADVWLNNPRRPREASGTSGQKASLNGNLNFSCLDGWWPEGFDGQNGWAIGDNNDWTDLSAQDAYDVETIYNTLEHSIISDFQNPELWVSRMKQALKTCAPVFNTHRMVLDYIKYVYTSKNASTNHDTNQNPIKI